jgi:hypothetical protein
VLFKKYRRVICLKLVKHKLAVFSSEVRLSPPAKVCADTIEVVGHKEAKDYDWVVVDVHVD